MLSSVAFVWKLDDRIIVGVCVCAEHYYHNLRVPECQDLVLVVIILVGLEIYTSDVPNANV